MKKDMLNISYKINSIYGNHADKNIYRYLNILTVTIKDWIDKYEKNKLSFDEEIELIKSDREQIRPDLEIVMELYDTFIEESERLFYFNKD